MDNRIRCRPSKQEEWTSDLRHPALAVQVALSGPQSALGTYILLRGLLEVWAYLDFIENDGARSQAGLRAIRYELGVIREWENSARDAMVNLIPK
jgi:hypothetical protein